MGGVQGLPGLQRQIKASLGYVEQDPASKSNYNIFLKDGVG